MLRKSLLICVGSIMLLYVSSTACAKKSETPHTPPVETTDTTEKIIGADISFLPQLEAE